MVVSFFEARRVSRPLHIVRSGAIWALALHTPAGAADDEPRVETDALHPYVEAQFELRGAATSGRRCGDLYADLMDAAGDELVELVRHADVDCIADLERVDDPPLQIAVSREANVVAIGNGVASVMEDYDGTYREGVKTLFTYLRVVADIHHRCLERRTCSGDEWDRVETYSLDPGSPAHVAVNAAIDSFVDNPRLLDRRRQHGDTLREVAMAINDYDMQEHYLHVVAAFLNAWDEDYAARSIFQDAMEQLLGVVDQGHRREAFGPVFGEDRDLVIAFSEFVLEERRLGTSSHWIMDRSATELGRYTRYRGTTNYDYVVPIIKSVLKVYEDNAEAKSIRLRLIAEIDYNDANRCERYDLCEWYEGRGFNANFREALFVDELACPTSACPADTITIHAQNLGSDKLQLACERLTDHAEVFQSTFATNCRPVEDDFNSGLEIFVFNDGPSCEALESGAFGRNADSCSGIYWEGDPSNRRTTARFVATEYTPDENPRDPELAIWSFEHEYGQYLDGRYNRHGPSRAHDPSVHWWVDGFAEYFAAKVSPHIHPPSYNSPYSLTETLLESGSIPTRYAHRHLAVRYLMQNRRDFIDTLLARMRAGEWHEYRNHMAEEAPKYEAEWRAWLRSRGAPQALNQVRRVAVTPGPARLTVSWQPVHGATGYRLRWTSDRAGSGQARVGERTRHTIVGLIAGQAYSVEVVATRAGLADGPPSRPVKGTPSPPTASLSAQDDPVEVDLRSLFGAGATRFGAVSSDPGLVTATIRGTRLVITANDSAEGVAAVSVTATDAQGVRRRQVLLVTIEASTRSWLRGWRRALLEQLAEGD